MEEFGISGGDGGEDETERERLIRMGLITPFESGLGSIISSSSSSSSLSTERSEPFDDKDGGLGLGVLLVIGGQVACKNCVHFT